MFVGLYGIDETHLELRIHMTWLGWPFKLVKYYWFPLEVYVNLDLIADFL